MLQFTWLLSSCCAYRTAGKMHHVFPRSQGMVCVKVHCGSEEARDVVIEVLDTGCGIPQKDMARLLVPFSQV